MLFEKASRMKLRISSSKGSLAVEDLWDLKLTDLNAIAKDLNKKVKEYGEEDFLAVSTPEEAVDKLRFDLVIHVLNTKKAEAEEKSKAVEIREKRQKLLGVLARKEEEALANLSPEEIRAQLQALK